MDDYTQTSLALDWDLDADGVFNDATGDAVTITAGQGVFPGTNGEPFQAKLRATNGLGGAASQVFAFQQGGQLKPELQDILTSLTKVANRFQITGANPKVFQQHLNFHRIQIR